METFTCVACEEQIRGDHLVFVRWDDTKGHLCLDCVLPQLEMKPTFTLN